MPVKNESRSNIIGIKNIVYLEEINIKGMRSKLYILQPRDTKKIEQNKPVLYMKDNIATYSYLYMFMKILSKLTGDVT